MSITYLFVPGSEERKVRKALASDADAVILDLEDAVPAAEKDAARAKVAAVIDALPAGIGREIWVRVNGAAPEFDADVDGIDWSRISGAFLPKAEHPHHLERLARAGVRSIVPLIESARGLNVLADLVHACNHVARLAIGTWDLALDLGLVAIDDPDDSELIWQIRGQLVVESRALGLTSPVDGVCAALHDDDRLRRVCTRVRQLGFGGKLLIHPDQVAVARDVFGVDLDRLAFAREVVAAYEAAQAEGRGAIQVRGRMIDRVMVDRALALLKAAAR
jgi:citrate lyase subunit beta/citryl-CoA lyase